MGKSGSVRVNTLSRQSLLAMQRHELRQDATGKARSIRDVPPLIYDESGDPRRSLIDAYDAHVDGAKRNKSAAALASHAFVQFPTDIDISAPDMEQKLLLSAVQFINSSHGGRAVFHARLDRDESGRHGVDVFYAPLYEKKLKDGSSATWVSLSKHVKDLAKERTGKNDVRNQGRALQDAFYAHLKADFGDWVERGQPKLSLSPDRLEPEIYKIQKERELLKQESDKLEAEKRSLAASRSRDLLFRSGFDAAFGHLVDGDIVSVFSPHKDALNFKPSERFLMSSGNAEFRNKFRPVMHDILLKLKPFADMFLALSVHGRERRIFAQQAVKSASIKRRKDSGFEM